MLTRAAGGRRRHVLIDDAGYRRSESQKRFSFFFSSTTLSGAFGGLLAAAIGKMDGVAGYAGWRWVSGVLIKVKKDELIDPRSSYSRAA